MPSSNFGVVIAPEPFVWDVGMHGGTGRASGVRRAKAGHLAGVGLVAVGVGAGVEILYRGSQGQCILTAAYAW